MSEFLRTEFDTPAYFEAEPDEDINYRRSAAFDYNNHMPTINEEVRVIVNT